MIESQVPAPMSPAQSVSSSKVPSVLVGVVVGALTSYVTAVVATAQIPGNFTINPLTLAMIALVGALAVVVAGRWPIVGLTAGLVIIAIILFAITGRVAWSANNWLDPFNAIGFGAASGYPTLIGVTMITTSALGLRSRAVRSMR